MAKKIHTALLLLLVCLFLTSCTGGYTPQSEYPLTGRIKVVITSGEGYSSEKNIMYAEKGKDLSFEIKINEGYVFYSCSYGDYTASDASAGNTVVITLRNVTYPCRVDINTETLGGIIIYDFNGGYKENYASSTFTEECVLKHLRYNTDTGKDVKRDGYILTGWNTACDGSGTHTGLGSRVTISRDSACFLYAEWEKCAPDTDFEFSDITDKSGNETGTVMLTKYTGPSCEKLVIPEKVGGKTVTIISPDGSTPFASDKDFTRLILPPSLTRVEDNSFSSCTITELMMWDSISYITESGIKDSVIKKMYINAAAAPRYQKDNEIGYFADAMDRLILNKNKNKIVFFGGCSVAYGLKGEPVQKAYGDYRIINMGIIGGTNAAVQFDMIAPYMKDGDYFIHAPECGSEYQIMSKLEGENRMYLICEGNYDLLSLADLSVIDNKLTAFTGYNSARMEKAGGAYSDTMDMYDEYGLINTVRPMGYEDKKFANDGEEYLFKTECLSARQAANLSRYYGKISGRGAEVLVSFSPVNFDGLTQEQQSGSEWNNYENTFRSFMSAYDYPVISRQSSFVYSGKYFYDTDYHLNDTGAELRTNQLLNDMKDYIKK